MSTKKYNMVSDSIRDLVISGHIEGYRPSYLAETYKVNLNTVNSIIRRFKQFKKELRPRGKRPNKLNEEQMNAVREYVDLDCTRSLSEIADFIHSKFEIRVCLSTVHRYLEKIHYTFKRLSPIPARRNCESTINFRYDYAMKFFEIDSIARNRIYFIDEAGIAIHIRTNYGRSLKGTRANLAVKAIKGKNYSVCAAMNVEGLHFYECKDTSYDGASFDEYIKQFLGFLSAENITNAFIVMDNVRFHHCELIKNEIQSAGHELIFLPPYSPFLNPIENLFNQLKHYVKKYRPTNPTELFQSVELASQMISEQECQNNTTI